MEVDLFLFRGRSHFPMPLICIRIQCPDWMVCSRWCSFVRFISHTKRVPYV